MQVSIFNVNERRIAETFKLSFEEAVIKCLCQSDVLTVHMVQVLRQEVACVCVHVQVLRTTADDTGVSTQEVAEPVPPQLARFKFLSSKLAQITQLLSHLGSTVHEQLDQYLAELQHLSAQHLPSDVLSFWLHKTCFNLLAPLAEDFVCAPASQAFVERIFSVCGFLSKGRRSSMHKSLEMRTCLKLNARVLASSGFL